MRHKRLYAWFSPSAARVSGYVLYRDVGGRQVAVTEVRYKRKKPSSVWPDLRYVARVWDGTCRVGEGPDYPYRDLKWFDASWPRVVGQ